MVSDKSLIFALSNNKTDCIMKAKATIYMPSRDKEEEYNVFFEKDFRKMSWLEACAIARSQIPVKCAFRIEKIMIARDE